MEIGLNDKVAVIGAGSWGTALARRIASSGRPVSVWEKVASIAGELEETRENRFFLPGFTFPESLHVSSAITEVCSDARLVLIAIPSEAFAEVCSEIAPYLPDNAYILSAAKGLDKTGERLSQVAARIIPGISSRICALSGPNLAVELAREAPTVSVIASENMDAAESCRSALGCPIFRIYTNRDIIGVELGGALKNVIAIGAGICEGMGFGDNTKAALLTRGLSEMTRLGVALGARAETFAGLSGVGDLIATSCSRLSRNLRVGLALGQGRSLDDALAEIKQVAEGIPATRAAIVLAGKTGVEMPISQEIHAVLFEGRPASEALGNLMSRKWKEEPPV